MDTSAKRKPGEELDEAPQAEIVDDKVDDRSDVVAKTCRREGLSE